MRPSRRRSRWRSHFGHAPKFLLAGRDREGGRWAGAGSAWGEWTAGRSRWRSLSRPARANLRARGPSFVLRAVPRDCELPRGHDRVPPVVGPQLLPRRAGPEAPRPSGPAPSGRRPARAVLASGARGRPPRWTSAHGVHPSCGPSASGAFRHPSRRIAVRVPRTCTHPPGDVRCPAGARSPSRRPPSCALAARPAGTVLRPALSPAVPQDPAHVPRPAAVLRQPVSIPQDPAPCRPAAARPSCGMERPHPAALHPSRGTPSSPVPRPSGATCGRRRWGRLELLRNFCAR